MIDRNSNTSRLIDKLVDKHLVRRDACPEDRRRGHPLDEEGAQFTDELANIMDAEMSLLQNVWSHADAKKAIDTLDAWNETQS